MNGWRTICWVALAGATAWSGLLILAGFFLPIYTSETSSSDGTSSTSTTTLVGENGLGAAIPLVLPLLVSLTVAALLTGTGRWRLFAAWILSGSLAMLTLLAILSIGIFITPVTLALGVACLTSTLERASTRP